MLFNSAEFILFFPLVIFLYFALPLQARRTMLFVAGCIFYMAWIPSYVLILFLIIGIDYCAALAIESHQGARRKLFYSVSLVANLGLLATFKYFNFITENVWSFLHLGQPAPLLDLILPIGLSFHTFQALAYTTEVYRGRFPAERNLLTYALYVMFFPQLVAGPIERPKNLIPQLKLLHRFDADKCFSGLKLMLWGFFKKCVVADRLSVIVDSVYNHPGNFTGWPLLLATVCFAYQIYCDFSGYTDIAIGAARVMGIDLMRNFNRPYAASTIREFWHRWHISLSTWFRDYLYIPLGGSSRGHFHTCMNLLIVFVLSGLWHGAAWTYVVWGLVHGILLIIYRELENSFVLRWLRATTPQFIYTATATVVTFALVCVTWVFFRAHNLADATWVLTRMWQPSSARLDDLGVTVGQVCIAALGVTILELVQYLNATGRLEGAKHSWSVSIRWPLYYVAMLFVVLFGSFDEQRFIYFQF